VGCANGFVAMWNLSELHSVDQSPSLAADECDSEFHYRPSFYHSLHPSYILSLSTAFPSHDYLLVSCSIDGYFRLTDIRNPMVDFVFSQRTRAITPAIDYHPHIQSFISADDNDFIRAAPIRRFQSQQAFAKAGGHVSSISVGKCHVSTLISSADGTVIITNPMRKVLDGKAEQYQQIWFRHEWVHKPASQDTDVVGDPDWSKPKSINRMNVPRSGISRITEGYSVDTMPLLRTTKGDSKLFNATFSTIFERESAASQVTWNPNLHCGGWAAAGMGSGLVRVEDLAI
jgi:transcription factor C subunit 6